MGDITSTGWRPNSNAILKNMAEYVSPLGVQYREPMHGYVVRSKYWTIICIKKNNATHYLSLLGETSLEA